VRIGAAGVPPLDAGEEGALSYAALYHPWLAVRADGAAGARSVSIPPDGAACGRIARRSIARGPWVAPANEALEGVLAADPALAGDAQAGLLRAGVNVIRPDPRGFVIAGADTLAADARLRPINVRRLLILLRRVVLREGVADVFEPHDRAFRATVVRRLEVLLSDLYRRGAFAGATSTEAFRVVGDASNNPAWSVEQGRFVVDVLVAPAQPMTFIRVRLVQSGPGAVAVEAV
jgi:phage tail sheath protein FI